MLVDSQRVSVLRTAQRARQEIPVAHAAACEVDQHLLEVGVRGSGLAAAQRITVKAERKTNAQDDGRLP
eukprot:2709506-Rhodomonas_salina.1